jgi:hypothetical protein
MLIILYDVEFGNGNARQNLAFLNSQIRIGRKKLDETILLFVDLLCMDSAVDALLCDGTETGAKKCRMLQINKTLNYFRHNNSIINE